MILAYRYGMQIFAFLVLNSEVYLFFYKKNVMKEKPNNTFYSTRDSNPTLIAAIFAPETNGEVE